MGGGSIYEIKCAKSDAVYVIDVNDNDRLDPAESACFLDDEDDSKSCYANPLEAKEVKDCLKGLGVDLSAPMAAGKKLSVLSELSDALDFIRYGDLSKERLAEVALDADAIARGVGLRVDFKTASRISREGSADLVDASFKLAERSAATPRAPRFFMFEDRLKEAREIAAKAGLKFDAKRADSIRRTGYANAHEEAKAFSVAVAVMRVGGFALHQYETAGVALEMVFDFVRSAAKFTGLAFDEEWAEELRGVRDKSTHDGVAELLEAASLRMDEVYEEYSFSEMGGHKGLDYLKLAVTLARDAAERGGFPFDSGRFEKAGEAFAKAVYAIERSKAEYYATVPDGRFLLEVGFFNRARLWAHVAGVEYDADWEERLRQNSSDQH